MELGVRDKVTLVTGGSKGIGLACVRAFLVEGARVAIASRNTENLEAARRSLNANSERLLVVTADLVQAENASTMLRQVQAHFGPVDILINSAGAARRSLPEDVDAAAWHAAMDAKYFTYAPDSPNLRRQCGANGQLPRPLVASLSPNVHTDH